MKRNIRACKKLLSGFLKSRRNLALRNPQVSNLCCISSFSVHNVNNTFTEVKDWTKTHMEYRWNHGDESLKTKLHSHAKGIKPVSAVTSSELGS